LKNTKYTKRTITFIQHKASKRMNLYHRFNEENCSSLSQLQTYIQMLCLWLENFFRSRRTVFIKPRINRFNFKWTYFVLDRLTKNQKRVQGWEDQYKHTVYWFTHNELHPVSPYSKVESTKNNCNQLQYTTVLEPYKNHTTKAEKIYFITPCTPRNPIKEWLTLTPFTRKNKRKITPERKMQEHKPIVPIAAKTVPTPSPRSRFS